MSAAVDAVASAAAAGATPLEVLDLADDAIERAAAESDRALLARLATVLAVEARRGPEWSGLAIAAARAEVLSGSSATMVPASPAEPASPDQPVPEVATALPVAAGWWRRTAAFAVDWLALGFGYAILDAVTGGGDGEFVTLVTVALPLAYFAGMHAFVHGATIGKALFGISVHALPGRPVGVGRAAWRACATTLLWITVIGGIVDMLVGAADDNSRWMHDKLAGTAVICRHR